jgi:hypothetical protein
MSPVLAATVSQSKQPRDREAVESLASGSQRGSVYLVASDRY